MRVIFTKATCLPLGNHRRKILRSNLAYLRNLDFWKMLTGNDLWYHYFRPYCAWVPRFETAVTYYCASFEFWPPELSFADHSLAFGGSCVFDGFARKIFKWGSNTSRCDPKFNGINSERIDGTEKGQPEAQWSFRLCASTTKCKEESFWLQISFRWS